MNTKQIHKNQTKPEQNLATKMAMDPTSVSLPHTSSPWFEYIFNANHTDMQASMMYNRPAQANSAKWFEEINTWLNS